MVDPLGAFTIIIVVLLIAGIYAGYYFSEDFTGIAFGVAITTATAYVLRSWWLGLATKLVGGS